MAAAPRRCAAAVASSALKIEQLIVAGVKTTKNYLRTVAIVVWARAAAMAASVSWVSPEQSTHHDGDDKEHDEDHDEDFDEDHEHLAGLHEAERLDRFDEEHSSTQSQCRPLSSI